MQIDNYYGPNGEPVSDAINCFIPSYCFPPPYVFHIPDGTPEQVEKEILSAFSIFFSDYHSAANKIRTSLELLLTYENIPKSNTHWKLESRLEKLMQKYKLKDKTFFNAIRLIGDEGSHGGNILEPLSQNSVLDIFELLEYILHELYQKDKHLKHLTEISKKLTAKYKK